MRPRVHQRGSGNAAMKKARGIFARASYAVLVNTEFVEDSVTRSQAFSRSRARKMRAPCKQQEKNRKSGMRIQQPALSHKRLCGTLLRSLPLAVAHEAVALYEMQMLLPRLTPAIFISLGNAFARRCNLSRGFWFH
jgi:hypothetical protein